MKKLLITIVLLAVTAVHAKPSYLFTNVSKSISDTGLIQSYKPDEVTWIFDRDSSIIRVITEMEDLSLRLDHYEKVCSPEDGICSDVYRTDIGTIYIDFALDETNEFLGICWVISGNEYIFKMK